MFSLGMPFGLWGLLALSIPLILHLVRRPTRTVRLGSLRFLGKERPRIRSVHWQHRRLMVLRCAFLAVLAFMLAGLRWHPTESKPVRWVVSEPGTTWGDEARRQETLLLATGFSRWPGEWTSGMKPWDALVAADAQAPAGSEAVVFASLRGGGFAGPRPTLHHLRVRWIAVDATPVLVAGAMPSVRVALRHAADRSEDARVVEAALLAVASLSEGKLLVVDERPTHVVLLGSVELPAGWHPQAVYKDSAVEGHGELSVQPEGGVRTWTYGGRFDPSRSEWVTTEAFPRWWRERLLRDGDAYRGEAEQLIAVDQALPEFIAESGEAYIPPPPVDLRGVLWVVAFVLLVIERVMRHRLTGDQKSTEATP